MMAAEAWASVDDIVKHLGAAKGAVSRRSEARVLPDHGIGQLRGDKLSTVSDRVRPRGVQEDDGGGQQGKR